MRDIITYHLVGYYIKAFGDHIPTGQSRISQDQVRVRDRLQGHFLPLPTESEIFFHYPS